MIAVPSKKSLALLPTPFQSLDRLSQRLGGPRIWMKRDDLTGCVLSGNKVRKLEFIVQEALDEGVDTLITSGGWNSNHCRATAFIAAQLGMKAHLILRDDGSVTDDGNLFLDSLAGAKISIYPAKQYQAELHILFESWRKVYESKGHKCRLIPTGGSDASGVWGYLAAYQELQEDFDNAGIVPSHIFCASGSGGTQAGLTLGAYLNGSSARVVGVAVCDSANYFNEKVCADVQSWREHYGASGLPENLGAQIRPETWEHYIGPGYGQVYPEVVETIRLLGATEGILLDPIYTGKAFYGMLSGIRNGDIPSRGDVVFVHTGGIFGLFPYRSHFSQVE